MEILINIVNNFRKILLHTPVSMTQNHENLQKPFICDVVLFGTICTNFKNVKNIHGGVLLWVKLQDKACYFTKITFFHGCFSRFFKCTNGTKLRNTSHVIFDALKRSAKTIAPYFFLHWEYNLMTEPIAINFLRPMTWQKTYHKVWKQEMSLTLVLLFLFSFVLLDLSTT